MHKLQALTGAVTHRVSVESVEARGLGMTHGRIQGLQSLMSGELGKHTNAVISAKETKDVCVQMNTNTQISNELDESHAQSQIQLTSDDKKHHDNTLITTCSHSDMLHTRNWLFGNESSCADIYIVLHFGVNNLQNLDEHKPMKVDIYALTVSNERVAIIPGYEYRYWDYVFKTSALNFVEQIINKRFSTIQKQCLTRLLRENSNARPKVSLRTIQSAFRSALVCVSQIEELCKQLRELLTIFLCDRSNAVQLIQLSDDAFLRGYILQLRFLLLPNDYTKEVPPARLILNVDMAKAIRTGSLLTAAHSRRCRIMTISFSKNISKDTSLHRAKIAKLLTRLLRQNIDEARGENGSMKSNLCHLLLINALLKTVKSGGYNTMPLWQIQPMSRSKTIQHRVMKDPINAASRLASRSREKKEEQGQTTSITRQDNRISARPDDVTSKEPVAPQVTDMDVLEMLCQDAV